MNWLNRVSPEKTPDRVHPAPLTPSAGEAGDTLHPHELERLQHYAHLADAAYLDEKTLANFARAHRYHVTLHHTKNVHAVTLADDSKIVVAFKGTSFHPMKWGEEIRHRSSRAWERVMRRELPPEFSSTVDQWKEELHRLATYFRTFHHWRDEHGVNVHPAFQMMLEEETEHGEPLPAALGRDIDRLLRENPYRKLVICGHSAGGATATLFAWHLLNQRPDIDIANVYTFAQPRVGNQAFADAMEEKLGRRFLRIANTGDFVPSLTPRMEKLTGEDLYTHAGHGVLFHHPKDRVDPSKWDEYSSFIATPQHQHGHRLIYYMGNIVHAMRNHQVPTVPGMELLASSQGRHAPQFSFARFATDQLASAIADISAFDFHGSKTEMTSWKKHTGFLRINLQSLQSPDDDHSLDVRGDIIERMAKSANRLAELTEYQTGNDARAMHELCFNMRLALQDYQAKRCAIQRS